MPPTIIYFPAWDNSSVSRRVYQKCLTMKKNVYILKIFILFFFTACQKEFNYNLNDNHIVDVMCFLKAGDTVRVNLSYTFNGYELASAIDKTIPYPIENAEVYIYEENELKEKLTYDKNVCNHKGWYKSLNYFPIEGKNYTLKVIVPNYDTIYAETKIPQKTKIDTVTYNYEITNDGYSEYMNFYYNLKFTDPAKEKNYYYFDLKYYYYGLNDALYKTYDPLIETKLYNDGSFSNNNSEIKGIFSDSLFNGETYTFKYQYEFNDYQYNDTLILKHSLFTISRDAYLFYKTIFLQYKNAENPLVEPVVIYSNIKNGTGIFAGIVEDSLTTTAIISMKK